MEKQILEAFSFMFKGLAEGLPGVVSDATVEADCKNLFPAPARLWNQLTRNEICNAKSQNQLWTSLVPEREAKPILQKIRTLLAERDKGAFKDLVQDPQKLSSVEWALNAFMEGGYLEEFQYALQVELEHGTVNGANVTNNHPLFTGVIVLSHLTEDPLYYTRLWPMEVSGEIFTATLHKEQLQTIDDLKQELTRAIDYLSKREKAATPWKI